MTVDRLTRHNADARVEVECKEDAIQVTTTNIDALSLRLDEAPDGYKTFRDKEDHCIKIVLKPWEQPAAA